MMMIIIIILLSLDSVDTEGLKAYTKYKSRATNSPKRPVR